MERTILISLDREEFRQIIREELIAVLQSWKGQQAETKSKGFISTKEAARFLKISINTLYGMTSKRLIPFIKNGKKLYFKRADLIAWLEKGRKATVQEIQAEEKFKLQERGNR